MVGARIVGCEVCYEMRPEKFKYDVLYTFDDCVKPMGGGGSLFHSFGKRLK